MRRRTRLRLVLPLLLIAVTLIFIWSNSLKDATASGEQSDAAASLFCRIFDVERQPFRFLYENLRKVAHFTEFALLGAEVALLFLWNRKREVRFCLLGIAFCAVCAAIDECIQYFVPGRAALLLDVGIDTAGSACALIFLFLLAFLIARIAQKRSIKQGRACS